MSVRTWLLVFLGAALVTQTHGRHVGGFDSVSDMLGDSIRRHARDSAGGSAPSGGLLSKGAAMAASIMADGVKASNSLHAEETQQALDDAKRQRQMLKSIAHSKMMMKKFNAAEVVRRHKEYLARRAGGRETAQADVKAALRQVAKDRASIAAAELLINAEDKSSAAIGSQWKKVSSKNGRDTFRNGIGMIASLRTQDTKSVHKELALKKALQKRDYVASIVFGQKESSMKQDRVNKTKVELRYMQKKLLVDLKFAKRATHRLNATLDCAVGQWQKWSPCSVSCGGGHRHRTRNVTVLHKTAAVRDLVVCPGTSQSEGCQPYNCTCAESTTRTAWSACSVSCGKGIRHRFM
jgi:hypothetical protein